MVEVTILRIPKQSVAEEGIENIVKMVSDLAENDGVKKEVSAFVFLFRSLHYLIVTDIFVYGCLIPLLGTWIGGQVASWLDAPGCWEVILVASATFALMYIVFCLIGEACYWKHLFGFNPFFGGLLQIRDFLNSLVLIGLVGCMAYCVENLVNQDKEIKHHHVGEGVFYYFVKTVLDWLKLDPAILHDWGWKPPIPTHHRADDNGHKTNQHDAMYMLIWSMLTATVAKLVYFNTLFTYLRAMEIFLSLNPCFEDDEDDDQDTIAADANKKPMRTKSYFESISSFGPPKNTLEYDFAQHVKKPTP